MTSPQVLPEIVDLTLISRSFPDQTSAPEILREGVLTLIKQTLAGDVIIFCIDGESGHGKTYALKQFAKSNADSAISLFVKATSRLAYDFRILLFDLCNQMNWAVTREELDPEKEIDDGTIRTLTLKLQKFARVNRRIFYFVIDGLDEIPREAEHVRAALLDILPFGLSHFKFVISGVADSILKGKGASKTLPLPYFSLPETKEFLSDLGLSDDTASEIHRTCFGVPGRLADAKRILKSGISSAQVLEEMGKQDGLLQLEWAVVDRCLEADKELLALLALDDSQFSVEMLSDLFGRTTEDIHKTLTQFRFLVPLSGNCNETFDFVSSHFKAFAAHKLGYLRQGVQEKIADFLLGRPDTDDALSRLSHYLQQVGREADLLKYLSPDRLAVMVERSQSTLTASHQTEIGMQTAVRLENFAECMRFGLQKSAVAELDGSQILESEIRAWVALGQFDEALALANSAVLKQDRLRLLARIGRKISEQGLSPRPELLEEISRLFEAVDFTTSSDWINELASDLIYCRPELAMRLIDSFGNRAASTSLDWDLVKLSVQALAGKASAHGKPREQIAEDIKKRIKDPIAARFSATLAILLQDYSADRVLAEAAKLSDPKDKLYMLRSWTHHTRQYGDAARVIQFALEMTVATSTYSPHASHLRTLATPLPHLADSVKVKELISILDAQKSVAERLGPTEEFVRFQLLLMEAEMSYDFDAARARAAEVYYYVSYLTDLSTKAACTALLYAALPRIDSQRTLELKDRLHSLAADDLDSTVTQLLRTTADHSFATRNILAGLATYRPTKAIEIALSLNTEPRRDAGLRTILETQLEGRLSEMPLEEITRAIGLIRDDDQRDEITVQLFSRLAQTKNDNNLKARLDKLMVLSALATAVTDAEQRCDALVNYLVVLLRAGLPASDSEPNRLFETLEDAWNRIPDEWSRIDCGFRISSELALYDRDRSMKYARMTEDIRRRSPFQLGLSTYIANIRLAMRAFCGLLPTGLNTESDQQRLKAAIDVVPSLPYRVRLWLDLSLSFYQKGKLTEAVKVVEDELRPLLERVQAMNPRDWKSLLSVCAPALYMAHSATATELLSSLAPQWRDLAFSEIIDFILKKVPSSDPYDFSSGRTRTKYEDLLDVCSLMARLENDSLLYRFIALTVESAKWKENHIPRDQQEELARRLDQLITARLPAARFITHDGFRILSVAEVTRLRKGSASTWQGLIDESSKVPNIADRAMVRAYLAKAYSSTAPDRKLLFDNAKCDVKQIGTLLDKVDRLEMIANCASDIDKGVCVSCIREAMDAISKHDNPELASIQHRLVDLAHQVDKELAASLASALDDDPERKMHRDAAKEQLELLKLKESIADGSDDLELGSGIGKDLSQVAWMLLGALNANRVEPLKTARTIRYVQYASRLPMSKAFPILYWAIENANKRLEHSNEAKTIVRGLFESTLLGCELTSRLAARGSRAAVVLSFDPGQNKTVVRAGERSKALDHLRAWMSSEVSEYLKITDPYFGPEDLPILKLILSSCPEVKVSIMTSRAHQERCKLQQPWEETYQKHWRLKVSDQKPPVTRVMIAGVKGSGEAPIHDRWLLTKNGGLRLGTSFNSLGLTKDSDISKMDDRESREHEELVDQYLYGMRDEHNGQVISYTIFHL